MISFATMTSLWHDGWCGYRFSFDNNVALRDIPLTPGIPPGMLVFIIPYMFSPECVESGNSKQINLYLILWQNKKNQLVLKTRKNQLVLK